MRFPPPRSESDRSPPPPGAPCFRPRLGLGAVAQVRPPARSPTRSSPPAAAPPPRHPFPHRAGGSSQVAREALGWGSPAGDPGPGHRAQKRTLRRVGERDGGGARGDPGMGGWEASILRRAAAPRWGAAPVWVGQTPPLPLRQLSGGCGRADPGGGGAPREGSGVCRPRFRLCGHRWHRGAPGEGRSALLPPTPLPSDGAGARTAPPLPLLGWGGVRNRRRLGSLTQFRHDKERAGD